MSVWIIEREFMTGNPLLLAMCPLSSKLRKMYGGDYRAVEYRRVEPAEPEGVQKS